MISKLKKSLRNKNSSITVPAASVTVPNTSAEATASNTPDELTVFDASAKPTIPKAHSSALEEPALGLKELVPGVDPIADIVAVHGLGGHREKTWTDDKTGVMWLKDMHMLPLKCSNARIFTFGYDAGTIKPSGVSRLSLTAHAESLIDELFLVRSGSQTEQRPIIFLAYNLGGILVKHALVISNSATSNHNKEYRSIKLSTYGVMFFGTPHTGADGAELQRALTNVLSLFVQASSTNLRNLERDSEYLRDLSKSYLPISADFKTLFFFEEYDTPLLGGISKMIVPESSAVVAGTLNAKALGLPKHHINIVKYGTVDDPAFKKVSAHLSRLVHEASSKIEENWVLEARGSNDNYDNSRALPPPPRPSIFCGRDSFVAEAVSLIKTSQPARLAILGTGGFGKTSAALSILHHEEVQQMFNNRCYFVSCESATTVNVLLQAILEVFGVTPDPKVDPLIILHRVLAMQSGSLLLVLDNFETPWDESSDQSQVEAVLGRISAVPLVTLIVTMRGTIRPAGVLWTQPALDPLSPLSLDAAREAFLQVNPSKAESQPELDLLLRELECIPLAVMLVAKLAQNRSCSSLLKQWDAKHTTLLHTHGSKSSRLNSIEMSISMSLKSFSVSDQPEASALLALISHLPDGVLNWEPNLTYMELGFEDVENLASLLLNVALAYTDSAGNLRVLSPIRLYMLKYHTVKDDHFSKLESHYIAFISRPGGYRLDIQLPDMIRRIKPEVGNMTSLLLYGLSVHARSEIIQAILDLADFMSKASILGSAELINRVMPYLTETGMDAFRPKCLQSLGNILYLHANFAEATDKLQMAQEAFLNIDNQLEATQCMQSLGDILYMQDKPAEATDKLEKAHSVFLSIGNQLGAARCKQSLGNILRAQNNYAEATGKLEKAQKTFLSIDFQLGAAQCMKSLGEILYLQDNYAGATDKLEKAQEVFLGIGSQLGAAQCMKSLGDILYMQANYTEATDKLEMAQETFLSIGDQLGAVQCMQCLGDISYMQNNYAEATDKLEKAQSAFLSIGSQQGAAQCMQSLGNILRMQANYTEATGKLENAQETFLSISDELGAAQCMQSLGNILGMQAHYSEATDKLEKAQESFLRIGSQLGAAQCMRSLGRILYLDDNHSGAVEQLRTAQEIFLKIDMPSDADWCKKFLDIIVGKQNEG